MCVCVYVCVCGGEGIDMVTRVQILDKTVCILHSANTLEKGMNPIILAKSLKLGINSRAD